MNKKQPEQSKALVVLLVLAAAVGGYFTQVKGPRAENQELKAKEATVADAGSAAGPNVKPDGGTLAASRLLAGKNPTANDIDDYVRGIARRNNVEVERISTFNARRGAPTQVTVEASGSLVDAVKFARQVSDVATLSNGQLRVRRPAVHVSGLAVTETSGGANVKFSVSSLG